MNNQIIPFFAKTTTPAGIVNGSLINGISDLVNNSTVPALLLRRFFSYVQHRKSNEERNSESTRYDQPKLTTNVTAWATRGVPVLSPAALFKVVLLQASIANSYTAIWICNKN